MPLERRVQPPRTYQRTYRGNSRQQPYRLTRNLPETATAGHPSQVWTATDDSEQCAPTGASVKRTSHARCTCRTRADSTHRDENFSNSLLGNVAEEAQRILPDQWPHTNENQNASLELRNDDIIFSEPNTSTASITSDSTIPTTVPITNSHNIVSSFPVTSFSETAVDCSQSEVVESGSVAVELCNVELEQGLCGKKRCPSLQQDDSWSPTPAIASLRARSMPAMPLPSVHARQVANRVIKHARANKTPDERALRCPDCQRLPLLPVTGQCGHTRCKSCIQNHGACPCGMPAPKNLHVNTLIQDLIRKILPRESYFRMLHGVRAATPPGPTATLCRGSLASERTRLRWQTRAAVTRRLAAGRPSAVDVPSHILITSQARLDLAKKLLNVGRLLDAAPHLARVAASNEPFARIARTLLIQAITSLSNGRDPRRLCRQLFRAVRAQAAASWLKPIDLECVLCYHAFTSPVTTPCGHTYCRTCIERSMDYRKSCALCLRSLDDFDLAATRETVFVCAALASIDALNPPPPPDPDVIPIFVCTVAYPAIPCPLFIFDPRYWLMIRRVLESGSRKFGMVAYERDRSYSDYGTVLEVCDCVHFEDGRSILSTVGVSRFRVIERDVRDGCDVARIQPLTDITPTEELVIWELRIMATQISYKALLWLNSMNRTVRAEIETAFGQLPLFDQEDWWESSDGPAWLWWLIAILPLRSEIKILILSTKNLLKRMMAVSRTLEAIDKVAISATATSVCELRSALTNAEEWLERSA